MRKLKLFSVALVLVMMASSVFGCYFIQAQPMSKVKGTGTSPKFLLGSIRAAFHHSSTLG
jgi:hypothetical protein